MKNKQSTVNGQRSTVRCLILIAYCIVFLSTSSCGIYSFTGVSITAKNISITEFYNNTDLGPANLGQTFTNRLRDYMLQNTNLSIVSENGELQMDGIVAEFKISQVAPTVGSNPNDVTTAALTKLTITVKATYVNSADDSMSFKDRSFSFFENVDNDNPDAISEAVINRILDQIILDMFNASVANW